MGFDNIIVVKHSERGILKYELLFRQKGEPRDIGDIVLLYTFKIHLYISFISPTHNMQP